MTTATKKTIPLKVILLAIVFIVSMISIYHKYQAYKTDYVQGNQPKKPSQWHLVGENEKVKLFVDDANFNLENRATHKVDYWEKAVLTEGIKVPEEANKGLLLKIDAPLKQMISHYLVDCDRQSYQMLHASFEFTNGKMRYLSPHDKVSSPAPIDSTQLIYTSSDYACGLISNKSNLP